MTKAEQLAILAKYAEVAESELKRHFPNDYAASTIAKLAEEMIELDLRYAEEADELARIQQAGAIVKKAFIDELKKCTSHASTQ